MGEGGGGQNIPVCNGRNYKLKHQTSEQDVKIRSHPHLPLQSIDRLLSMLASDSATKFGTLKSLKVAVYQSKRNPSQGSK